MPLWGPVSSARQHCRSGLSGDTDRAWPRGSPRPVLGTLVARGGFSQSLCREVCVLLGGWRASWRVRRHPALSAGAHRPGCPLRLRCSPAHRPPAWPPWGEAPDLLTWVLGCPDLCPGARSLSPPGHWRQGTLSLPAALGLPVRGAGPPAALAPLAPGPPWHGATGPSGFSYAFEVVHSSPRLGYETAGGYSWDRFNSLK